MDKSELLNIPFDGLIPFKKATTPLNKEEFCQTLANMLNLKTEDLSATQMENIASNYILEAEYIRKDLSEISERIDFLKELAAKTPKDDTNKVKRIYHFADINKIARDEILEYYNHKFIEDLVENKNMNFSARSDDKLWTLFYNRKYEYSTFRRYFDFNYDFGTEAKIRFIPGVSMTNMLEVVKKYIDLKASSSDEYQAEIERMVKENDCISYLLKRVTNHYVLSKRQEIFATLVQLYNDEKYQSFISLAVLQLEGIFYDCCSIIAKRELGQKAGTLKEKAEKVYKNNRVMKLSVYPYFAFDVPDLRNEIAHNGMIRDENLSGTANEIILDLNSIISWVTSVSNDKYITLLMTMDKVNELPDASEEATISTIFYELFSCYQFSDKEFIDVLKNPNHYKDEIAFYMIPNNCENRKSLNEVVDYLSQKVKSKAFWDLLKTRIATTKEHEKGKLYDFIDFAIHIKNTFIHVLPENTEEGLSCREVAKLLNPYESKDKQLPKT